MSTIREGLIAQGGGHGSGQAAGQGASGPLGALMQSIGPMMQQLMVGAPHRSDAQGSSGTGPAPGSAADWRTALGELDGDEQAEWEKLIRCLTPPALGAHVISMLMFASTSVIVVMIAIMSVL